MISSQAVSRVIDANLNRVGEGLRLLEDVARLLLNDATSTEHLKIMRHQLTSGDWSFNQQLIQSRDSEADVGIDIEVPDEEKERELPLVVVANAKRVQESLRTLEELTKIPGVVSRLDPVKFKQARFGLYTIEQDLLSRLVRQDKVKRISGLYVIMDTEALKGRSYTEVANQVIRGGVKIIQLRDKLSTRRELLFVGRELKELCSKHDVRFIVNDYLDIALATEADGLHLGQEDLPVKITRQLLPMGSILGYSVRTVEQAVSAEADGADYIAVGSMYPTLSKEGVEVVGLERLRQIRQAVSLPLVAIGGITDDNAAEVIAAGANSVAVISAILGSESPEEATRQIVDRIQVANE
ncbi:thiamine phosphate synthase [Chloroflexota bacterium]